MLIIFYEYCENIRGTLSEQFLYFLSSGNSKGKRNSLDIQLLSRRILIFPSLPIPLSTRSNRASCMQPCAGATPGKKRLQAHMSHGLTPLSAMSCSAPVVVEKALLRPIAGI